ncbi:hemagglutinin repeat-containing protein [Halomonas sp. 18H]|nr:hemagglutinin repeat-containing protein [Halomonas sp. 18H]MCW4150737.1 hemagglutinin repeat-containing protein [Halomonas sp. 18H]
MNSRSPLSRYVTILIINALFWHPAVVLADGIVVAPGASNTSLDRAGNGVPVVDIATPNGSGLSHNRFSDYNVDERGVILNNATSKLQSTQLGGLIVGNPNLRDQAARRIINEVNGGRPSRLEGYTEVAGAGADVVVANPYGITCNGCGFINSPRVTLSTGRPIIENGDLERFAVDQGRVAIEGLGLDATQVDQFDIITRAAEVNAELHANHLNVITGANDVDAETLATTARQGTGEAPALAIDASALGGMYAGSIRLIGTESGVGVKLAGDMAASEGDILIDANGHLRLADASSTGQTQINAMRATLSGDIHASQAIKVRTRENLDIDGNLTSGGDITLDAETNIDNQGTVVAGIENDTLQPDADLTLRADRLDNHGWLDATERLMVTSTEAHNHGRLLADEIAVEARQEVTNTGTIQGERVTLTSRTVTNRGQAATLASTASLELDTDHLDNLGGNVQFAQGQDVRLDLERLDNSGGTLSLDDGDLQGRVGTLTNRGGRLTADLIDLDATSLDNSSEGLIAATDGDLNLDVVDTLDNSQGRLQASDDVTLTAATLTNNGGTIGGDTAMLTIAQDLSNDDGVISAEHGDLAVEVGARLDNAAGHLQARTGTLALSTGEVDNRGGVLLAEQAINASVGGALDNGAQGVLTADAITLDAAQLSNHTGSLVGDLVTLMLARLDNDAGLISANQGLYLDLVDTLSNRAGRLQATDGELVLNGGTTLDNTQGILVADSLQLTENGTVTNHQGKLIADAIALDAVSLDNTDDGLVAAGVGGMDITLSGALDNRHGKVQSDQALAIAAQQLDNRNGVVLTQNGALDTYFGLLQNQGGALQGDSATFTGDTLVNADDGLIAGLDGQVKMVLTNGLDNRDGQVLANGTLDIDPPFIDNRQGQLAGRTVRLEAGHLDNAGGMIEASENLAVDAERLTNTDGELRALGGDDSRFTIAGTFDNQDGRVELASDDATLEVGTLRNGQGQLQHAGSGLFQITADRLANAGGQVQGTGSGQVTLGRLDDIGQWQFNDALGFDLDQGLTLAAADRLATAGHLTLNLTSLDNRGQLLANDGLTLHASDDITNRGLISTQGDLAVSARHLTQRDGRLASGDTSTYHLGGNLDNQGFLTGVGDVDITTAYLDNRGTLGSQADLRIVSRGGIDNRPDTLLFAGGDMTLRGQRLFNRYGDIYSRGSLDFARDDQHTRANSLENRSGTIEAEKGLRFYTNDFLNTKDTFELAFQPIENRIEVNSQFMPGYDREVGTHQCDAPGSCYKRNEHKDSYNYTVTVHELGEYEIKEDSASGVIASNGDISIRANNLINSNSAILGNGNVSIFSATFQNSGGGLSKVNRQRAYEFSMPVYVAEHRNEAKNGWNTYYLSNQAIATFSSSVAEWNQRDGWDNHGNLLPLPIPLNEDTQQSDITTSTAQGSGARAVIQAGKQVTINASNNIQNGAVRNNVRTQIDGNLGNSATNGPVSTLDITLNRRTDNAGTRSASEHHRAVRSDASATDNLASTDIDATYRDVPFERIAPTQLSSFRLPQGRFGLFVRNTSPQSRYLVETNPEFTSAERLMGSDYLLDKLDYTGDGAYQLLGDGRYESRLVRDAVLANTGQRFLEDSLSDDYAQYRHLMDNAVAARDALQLSVGVGLTPAQTAALTHDIVWLEEQQVDGETVLAPVLYLAQVDERNVRGGSLVQGRDIDLIAGGDLVNVGTIRASDDLSATSGDSVLQGGLIEAGQRLALSARDSIRNALAGEIRGGQVSLAAREGDIVNDRTAVTAGHDRAYSTYLDQGGLISARDGLDLSAGRDIVNRAEIASQGNVAFLAGRDIVSEAVADARRQVNGYAAGVGEGSESTTQLGASISAGGDAALMAGRDVRLTASTVDADGALGVTAARDIRLDAVEDTTHDWGNDTPTQRWYGKRVDENTITQVGSQLSSGDDTQLNAGRDVRLTASEIDSGASLTMAAGNDILLDAAENQSQTQTGEWRRQSHTRRVEQAGSELKASDDIGLQAVRDVTAIASRAEAGGDLALDAGGDLTLAAAANVDHHESYTDTTNRISRRVRQQGSDMVAGDDLTMRSGRDMRLIASDARAGDDAFMIAGRDVELLAANDQDYSLYEKEESGLFSSSYQRDEINDIRAVGSRLESDGDLTVVSGADQRYQGARLEAGNDLTLASGGTIRFETASDVHTESHERSKSGFAWQSASGEGFTHETLRQSELVAQGERLIQAAEGLQIDVEEIDRRSVTRTIDAMVAANPDLAWLKEMEQRGDIDWRQVKAIHDSWDYSRSGLSQVAALALSITVAAMTSGAASSAIGAVSGTATGAGATSAASMWAAATETAAAGWANAAMSGAIAGATGSAVGAASQGLDWQQPAVHGAITGGLANYLAAGTYYDNPFNKMTDLGQQLSQGKLLDAGKVVGGVVMQKTWNRIAEKMASGVGLSGDELNWLLMAGSIAGDQLPGIGNRYKSDDREFTLTEFVGERGVMDRGLPGLPFDATDIALGYQGLPDASVRAYLTHQGPGGDLTGHSLGTLTANYLAGNGLAKHAELFSLPFGNIAAPDAHLTIGSGDVINGGYLGKFFNPDAVVAPLAPLQHPFKNYKAFIDANPELYPTGH